MAKIISITLASILSVSSAQAQDCDAQLEQCAKEAQTVIRMADDYIRGQQLELNKLYQINEQHQAIERGMQDAINKRDEEAAAWYRNPVLMPVLGFMAGSLAVVLVMNRR